jgi:hypothetical protein
MVETILFVALLGAALVPVVAAFGRFEVGARVRAAAAVALWLGLAALIVAAPLLWADRPAAGELAVTDRPIQVPTGDYVGSEACRNCHPHNHATWYDSYHRTMTQVAGSESVLGDFDGVELKGVDLNVQLSRKGDKFFAELSFSNPAFHGIYPVVLTTGSHNRQAYWLASGTDSRLMILPYMFLRDEKRWIPRHSAYLNPMCLQERPELTVFQADFDRWRTTCIKCHATHGRPHPELDETDKPGRRASLPRAVEFGISCEACHGPGGGHVRANRSPLRRYQKHLAGGADPTIVNPARLPHDRSSEVCGQCHAVIFHRSDEAQRRWVHRGYGYRPGDDLSKDPIRFVVRGRFDLMPDRPPDLPDPTKEGSFWSDGMIRASGREYNGLIDSPCFQRGTMSCLSCHRMHQSRGDPRQREEWADDQLDHGMDGNKACLQCHEGFAGSGALTKHTHHAADSPGSLCYNCHMPFTTYGILKAIRSHQITSPSVRASVRTGRPNACNQCHQDRTLAWTADHLAGWYGTAKPELSPDERRVAASVLWALRGDAGQRALMAWSYGWEDAYRASGDHWQAAYLAQLLEDRYDAVRFIAHRSLKRLPGFRDFPYDFNGPRGDRADAHLRALQTWRRSHDPRKRPFAPEVLMDAQGKVMRADFQRLWEQRDDRPMSINE